MNKYAMIWTTTLGYMPGTNAILNALEFYGFKDIDIYVLYLGDLKKELGEEYLKQWPNVKFLEIDKSISDRPRDAFWYCIYADIHFAIEKLKEYDAVLLWSADCCVVNNFSVYFEIADKLNKIIVGSNEQGRIDLSGLSKEYPYIHTWDVPYTDIPWFIPKSKVNHLEKILEYEKREDCKMSRMDSINYAIRDLDLVKDVFTTAGNLWVYNTPYILPVLENNKKLYSYRERMNSFHRRYWDVVYLKNYIRGGNEIAQSNALIFNKMWNFFNRECRVKWTNYLDIWDGKL